MDEKRLLERITVNPQIFGAGPLSVATGLPWSTCSVCWQRETHTETILAAYPWLEREDIQACLVYARSIAANERIEPLSIEAGS